MISLRALQRFHEWDFRAYVEKKRQAEAMRKDFMRRQAQVGPYSPASAAVRRVLPIELLLLQRMISCTCQLLPDPSSSSGS